MKKIKIKLASTMILMVLIVMSCNETALDTSPQSPTEAEYFTEEAHFERAIFAVYAKMNGYYSWNGGGGCDGGNCPSSGLWQLPGDDATTSGGSVYETFNGLQSTDGVVFRFFRAAYAVIYRANTALQKIAEESDGIYVTPNLKDYHRGEAWFLRSYMFYNLWIFYGRAPIVLERAQGVDDTFVEPSEGTQLLDQALTDLQEAESLLPATWDAANRGRATKNAANALIGKILLFRGTVNNSTADLTAALAAFDKITSVNLVANFGDNHAADTENNAESIFEYQASMPNFDNIWLPDEFNNTDGSMSTSTWVPFEGINSWGYGGAPYLATQKLRDAFEDDDPRLPLTMDPDTRAIRKYVIRDQKNQVAASSVNNPRIFRYADILLMQAEATLRSGGSTSEAIGYINEVRTRARGAGAVPANFSTTETDEDVIMQWIMDERFRELAFEETHRWFDLRRWHMAGIISLDDTFFDSDNAGFEIELPKHLYLPIPQAEIDANFKMTQNDGY